MRNAHGTDDAVLPAPRHAGRAARAVQTGPVPSLAVVGLRLVMGLVFLWPCLDKAFGLGYATTSSAAWVHGGSPTKGFLRGVAAGPAVPLFHRMAGTWWADWGFMLGMAAIGTALLLGIALRLAAAGGIAMLSLLWLAKFAPARTTVTGAPTGSANPVVDQHVVYALVLLSLAVCSAGARFSLRPLWVQLPPVRQFAWLA